MKKIFILLAAMISGLVLVSCTKAPDLTVYMPGAYIDSELLTKFKDKTGKNVRIITFDDNETALMQATDTSNRYDIIIPSDYAIEELASLDLIEKIDWSKIPSFNKNTDLVEELAVTLNELKNHGFDFLEYSVPYFWGSVGFLYNKNKISKELVSEKEWSLFSNSEYSAVVYDSSRDAFLMAIRQNGELLNTANQSQINTAEQWLKSIVARSNVSVLGDQILDAPGSLKEDLIQVYSGDAIYIMQENDKYDYYKPTYTNIWADGFVIPKNAKDKELAYEFIDFMLTYDSAMSNTLEVGYTTPVKKVFEDVIIDSEGFLDFVDTYRVVLNIEQDEFFRYNNTLKELLDNAWRRVRTN